MEYIKYTGPLRWRQLASTNEWKTVKRSAHMMAQIFETVKNNFCS